jgi:hypothetical protein
VVGAAQWLRPRLNERAAQRVAVGRRDEDVDEAADAAWRSLHVDDPVAGRATGDVPAAPLRRRLHQDPLRAADQRRHGRARARVEQRLQALQPLELDRLRRVVLERRRRRARARAEDEAEAVAVEADLLDQVEQLREVLFRLPGKPTMKSLESEIPGRAARSLRTVLLNSSAV